MEGRPVPRDACSCMYPPTPPPGQDNNTDRRRHLRVTVDLDIEGESIRGRVAGPVGLQPFVGWLGLLATFDHLVAGDRVPASPSHPMPPRPVRRAAGSAPAFHFPSGSCKLLSAGLGPAASPSVLELLLLPGRDLPPHLHRDWDVVLYVLGGHITVEAEEVGFRAEPGDLFSLPRGMAHGVRNPGPDEARLLALFMPSGIEALIADVGALRPIEAAAVERWRRRARAAASRYGTEFLGAEGWGGADDDPSTA